MATGNKQPLSTRVEQETVERVEDFQEAMGADDRSDAHRKILKIGLREAQGPVSQRVRQMALNAAYHLALVSIVILVVGALPGTLTMGRATGYAIVLTTVAVTPLAMLEVVRMLRGQSELSALFGGDG